jgi:C4-dicarboxylate-specific signal transduction histidine kinase
VLALLGQADDGKLAHPVNAYLEQLNERAGTLSIYVINTAGKVVASSNWRRADSFIGEDLPSAPIFARRWQWQRPLLRHRHHARNPATTWHRH